MTSIDGDFGFDAVFRKSAAELRMRLEHDARFPTEAPRRIREKMGVYTIFGGLGVLSLVIFVIGYSAIESDSPEIWIHRLMALALVQSILIGAVAMKLLPTIGHLSFFTGTSARLSPPIKASEIGRKVPQPRMEAVPPPLPEPPQPVIGGQLAGRDFMTYGDGSIEIDTLVGRRRFVSLDAAREFVGS
jgi:hypothetical protein